MIFITYSIIHVIIEIYECSVLFNELMTGYQMLLHQMALCNVTSSYYFNNDLYLYVKII